MAVRILQGEDGYKCFYCSTTMIAFGSIFYEDEDPEEFLKWLKVDPRKLTDVELRDKQRAWSLINIEKGDKNE